jgi:ribosomal protection tetracycline resistance protein
MLKKTLNLGILAHIDAGKTSLTERLLFDNGAISKLGSVNAGSTTTDTNELERERGITIRAAVAPFALGDLQVNLTLSPKSNGLCQFWMAQSWCCQPSKVCKRRLGC